MPKISKTTDDKNLRDKVFDALFVEEQDPDIIPILIKEEFKKINDRQYGVILTDLNGVERYVRIGAIVAEEREDMTARELMQSEIDKYNESVAKREEKKRKAEEKAQKDKEERERKAKEKEGAENVQ